MGGSFFPKSRNVPVIPQAHSACLVPCLTPVGVPGLGSAGLRVTCLQAPQWQGSAPLAHVRPRRAILAAELAAYGEPSPEGPQAPVLDEDTGTNGGGGEAHRAVTSCVWASGGEGVSLNASGGVCQMCPHICTEELVVSFLHSHSHSCMLPASLPANIY